MDPVSILMAAVGLTQASSQLITYLTEVKRAYKNIEEEINVLEQEITSLITTISSVDAFSRSKQGDGDSETLANDKSIKELWTGMEQVLMQSRTGINQLVKLLEEVIGKHKSSGVGRLNGLRKTIRKQDRDDEFMRIRQRLILNQSFITAQLGALNM
jgi:uncharacterized phage infection (PIP) family protein YhgE